MKSPEERARKKLEEAEYHPIDEEQAKKRLMIAEIVDALNAASRDKVAKILDQIKIENSEADTWSDTDPNKTVFYQDDE